MTTMTRQDAPAAVLALPPIRSDRYAATKSAVRTRCEHLGLSADQTRRCVDHAAALQRRGRSAGLAIAEGCKMARNIAANRRAYVPGGAA